MLRSRFARADAAARSLRVWTTCGKSSTHSDCKAPSALIMLRTVAGAMLLSRLRAGTTVF